VLLEISKSVTLDQPADTVWEIVRVPETVAACLPNIRAFERQGENPSYAATIEDKLGPFKVEVPVTIEVGEDASTRRMTAHVAGNDKRGQARVRGEVAATVVAKQGGSVLELTSRIEVLGRLATLGAVPMRRRADQIFDVFVRNLSARLSAPTSGVDH
jgi:carbon monoxide dehydrogenase subunit G